MKLTKCSHGHFYDADTYKECPFCSGQAQNGDFSTINFPTGDDVKETVTRKDMGTSDTPTLKKPPKADPTPLPLQDVFDLVTEDASGPDDDMRTRSYYEDKIQAPVFGEPVVGWLVCTKGKHFGQSFTLKSGRNYIGRDGSMDVSLPGESSVSRTRHAAVVYEPKERMFIAQPGDSHELSYVNGKVVLDNVVLKARDEISLGKVNLMLIPCCTKEFAWEDLEKDNGNSKPDNGAKKNK